MSEPDWLPEAKELRERRWSYARIGEKVGVSRSAAYHWLNRAARLESIAAGNERAVRLVPCSRCGKQRRGRTTATDITLCVSCSQTPNGGRRRTRRCKGCGEEFEYRPSRSGRGGYCSWDCWREHGVPLRRTAPKKVSGWRVSANFSLGLKGEGKCRNCGATSRLHLHHAIPRSMYRAGVLELLNGIPLCESCHMGWHHRRVTIYRDLFTPEEWAWMSAADLLGQNVVAWLDERYPPRPVAGAA